VSRCLGTSLSDTFIVFIGKDQRAWIYRLRHVAKSDLFQLLSLLLHVAASSAVPDFFLAWQHTILMIHEFNSHNHFICQQKSTCLLGAGATINNPVVVASPTNNDHARRGRGKETPFDIFKLPTTRCSNPASHRLDGCHNTMLYRFVS
jgi:hypothetical protein